MPNTLTPRRPSKYKWHEDWEESIRRVTVYLHSDGTLLMPYQSEAENFAIEACGTHDQVYFSVFRLGPFQMEYNDEYRAWVLTVIKKKKRVR